MKIVAVIGTRPEIIKLSEVLKLLDKHTELTIVHTGQNYDYELNEIFFKQLGLREPDHYLNVSKKSAAMAIADVIWKFDEFLDSNPQDAMLVYGDTNSCLCVISAKRRKIPIFHMEAGNRCFDLRVPEEINRKIVDHTSDINMPLSEHARGYLIKEGIRPETIIKTGSPMQEVLLANHDLIEASNILTEENLEANKYFIVSIHREENVDSKENFDDLLSSLEEITQRYKMPVLVSTHPRTRKKLEEINYDLNNNLLRFAKPYGFHEYNKLQKNAFCVISDSGTITEEASIFNLAAITIRQAHERPEGSDEGTIIMTGLKKENILPAIEVAVSTHDKKDRTFKIIKDYDVDNVSHKVLKTIFSYVHYVNRTTWKKNET